jgi:hypothetical protein
MRPIRTAFLWAAAAGFVCGEIIDQVAAIVGRQVITESEVERETRLEAFFGGKTPQRAEVLDRLIRQRLVFQEMEEIALPETGDEEIQEWLAEMRPPGADPSKAGLRPADLQDYARRQLEIDKFIDLRFRAGVQADDKDVEAYSKERLRPELERQGVRDIPPLEKVRTRVERAVLEERVNKMLDDWIAEMRQRVRVRIPQRGEP